MYFWGVDMNNTKLNLSNKSGKLVGIIGPMFSGKTSELLRRIKRSNIARKNWILFKPIIDQRYSKMDVVSHDLITAEAKVIKKSNEVYIYIGNNIKHIDDVFFDELQFFDSEIIPIIQEILFNGINITYAALQATSEGKPFPFIDNQKHIGDLLALPHEEIINLKAVCTRCGNDNAVFTFYTAGEKNEIIKVGGSETYTALCRTCFNELMNRKK